MKFSEVIAALEAGKKVQHEGTGTYFQIITPGGLQPRLVEVWPDGAWNRTTLEYRGQDTSVESSSSNRPGAWKVLS